MNIDDSRPAHLRLPVGHEVPRGAKLLRVCDGYKDLPDAIPCGLANCHTPHETGFVVSFARADGTEGEGMVGHVCGKNFFGADWTTQMREHDNRVRVAELHARALDALAECEAVAPVLARARAVLDTLQHLRTQINTATPTVAQLGEEAAKSGGRVFAGYDNQGAVYVTVPGFSFWTQDKFHRKCNRLESDIRIIHQRISDPNVTVAQLGALLASFGSARMRTREIIGDIASDLRALGLGDFKRLVAAAREVFGLDDLRMVQSRLQHRVPGTQTGDGFAWVTTVDLADVQPLIAEVGRGPQRDDGAAQSSLTSPPS